ncbi:MAG: hypothetical protein EOO03_11455, partial [Chitinophagaceae bacterium]
MLLYKLWNKYPVYIVQALFLAAAIAFFARPIGDDEAWVGEYAYWLHKDGYVHSMLMQGYYLHEKHVLTHHYLFLRVTTPLLYLLPWSIFTLRIIPVVFGLLTLVLMMQFASRDLRWNRQHVWLVAAVFLAIPVVQEFFTYYRPEFMLSAFGFASFWILSRKHEKALYMIPAGLLAGFAMLSHLNGMVLVFTGCIMLLWHRQWAGFFVFGFSAFVGFLPY